MDEPQQSRRKLPIRVQRALEVSKRLHRLILERKSKEKAAQQQQTVESKKGEGG